MILINNYKTIGNCSSCNKLLTEEDTYYILNSRYNVCQNCYEEGKKHEGKQERSSSETNR